MDPNNPNPINPKDYPAQAKALVTRYVKEKFEKTDPDIYFDEEGVYVVSFTFVLGSWKALLSTVLPDQMYYEVTHNHHKGETYLDAYKKVDNVVYEQIYDTREDNYRDAGTGQYVKKAYALEHKDTTVHER